MQHTLVAVFDNRLSAQQAIDDLVAGGFPRTEVSLSEGDPTGETGQEGAVRGADESIGASIKHFFRDLFGTDQSEHAQMYEGAVTRGHFVVTVTAPDEPEVERAADIVERHGPVDIDEHAAQWGAAGQQVRPGLSSGQQMAQGASMQADSSMQGGAPQGSAAPAGSSMQGAPLQGSQQRASGDSTAIPIIQEELQVGKREVQRGGVRIYQRVVTTPVHESIDLREEAVNVERHPVDRPASSADVAAFEEASFEVRETAEEPVIAKSARIVEEVVVGKVVTERQQQVDDTVRRTEVEVEQLGSADDDSYYRNHWNATYGGQGGSYDDYAPAYRYGSAMAGNATYRGRRWDEVEPSLRSDWEASNKGGSTWDKIKAAVRHGWDRITS